jgi:hypothetical protein
MPEHSHHSWHSSDSHIREYRLIWQTSPAPAPAPKPEPDTSDEILGDLNKAEGRVALDTRALAEEVTNKLVGWERIPAEKQQKILEQMIAKFSRTPEIVQNSEDLKKLTNSLQKKLADYGYAKELTIEEEKKDKDGKTVMKDGEPVMEEKIGYEELQESSRVSNKLEDRSIVTARGRMPNGTEKVMYKRMRIEKGGPELNSRGEPELDEYGEVKQREDRVILTNGKEVKIGDFIEDIQDPNSGYRAVDIDYAMDRIRDHQMSMRKQNRYALRFREKRLQRRMISLHRAMQRRGRGIRSLQEMSMQNLNMQLASVQYDKYRNTQNMKSYMHRTTILRRAKRNLVSNNPQERYAMLRRAEQKSREYLTRGKGYHIARAEGLEIRPGSNTTVSNRPKGTEGMTQREYQADYKQRAANEVNRIASEQIAVSKMDEAFNLVRTSLKGWTGDSRIKFNKGCNEIRVAGSRVIIRLRPNFYNPDTGEAISTVGDQINPEEIPNGGVAIGDSLAWEVIDNTVDDDHWHKAYQTTDVAKALTRMHVVLDAGNPSKEVMREHVIAQNERNPDKTMDYIDYPYDTLTVEIAEELGKFRGEKLIFRNLKSVSPEAMRKVIDARAGIKNSELWIYNLQIFEMPEIANELTKHTGNGGIIIFKGIEETEYNSGHRTALEELSKGLRHLGGDNFNIKGLNPTMYKWMFELKARNGDGDYEYRGHTPFDPRPPSTLL